MVRTLFDSELSKLNVDLIKMAHLVEGAMENVLEAFKEQDKTLAKEIMENDRFINDMERTIEALALNLMLRQQPIARDLRAVTVALKMVTDLERIGDQVADIAEIIISFENEYIYRTVQHIPPMVKKTKMMVFEAIDAFIKKDLLKAKIVKEMDDEVDALFEEVKQEVMAILKESSRDIDSCIDCLMISKHLEKIGDHAVNICEWLEFNQTGVVNEQRLL